MAKKLTSYQDIESIPLQYTYVSKPHKAWAIWTFLFGLLTGDLNPIHINWFRAKNYKSRLGGLSRHGISTVAQTESFIFDIFSFENTTEIIGRGYQKIRYFKPVNMGDKITSTFILIGKKVSSEKKYASCLWHITSVNQKGETVIEAQWDIVYVPIEKNLVKDYISPFPLVVNPIEVVDTPGRI